MPLRFFCLLALLLQVSFSVLAQEKRTLSGYVRDAASGESLIGVALYDQKTRLGTSTNTFGFYSLTVTAGDSLNLVVSYIGYEKQVYRALLSKDLQLDFKLKEASSELKEVEIVGSRSERVEESTRMGTIDVPVSQIKSLPALFGEVDVLRTLQLLPGVKSGNEAASGLYVRGGSPDQNLVLLDGVPVYNASHLFGFFSVFNADALNHVELIKGGFPARYGGRLSSVLDIAMKEGNQQELHGEGSIGIIATKFTIEGPIKKDTSSFILSGRRTYIDLLMRPFLDSRETGVFGYFFHDLNGKVNWKVSPKDRLYLSAYTGYDKFYNRYRNDYSSGEDRIETLSKSGLGWGNITTALRWNRQLSSKLFLNTSATFSRYQFKISQDEREERSGPSGNNKSVFLLEYFSNIRDWSLRTDFDYVPNPNHYIRFGAQATLHRFQPGALQQKGDEDFPGLELSSPAVNGMELGVYAEDEFKVSERLKINPGLRLAGFAVQGKFYPSLEPRVAARFFLTDEWALKASYARMTQFIHLLSNSGIGLPTDLWVPATKRVKPQLAHQVALGAARSLWNDKYELSGEVYYKVMDRLIEYRPGASFLGTTSDWENKVVTVKGWTYGLELFLQRKIGKTTGWIGYTLAWAERQSPELNEGLKYPYRYDRRHDISLVAVHQLKPDISISGTWVYGTGQAITLPQARYNLGDYNSVTDYGPRNSYRMKPYHRMDLSISHTKKKKWGEVVNNFSLYNAYSRKNPFYIYFEEGYYGRPSGFWQASLFPIIPSFSKSFKF